MKCVIAYYQLCSPASSYFKVSARNSQQHPCQLKVGTRKTSKKALTSKIFSIDTMLTQKDKFENEETFC